MKRFYCTVCKKIKRVRKWPHNVRNVESMDARAREGECNYHYNYQRRVVAR